MLKNQLTGQDYFQFTMLFTIHSPIDVYFIKQIHFLFSTVQNIQENIITSLDYLNLFLF